MNKIAIIGVYFGNFPEYMNLWVKSCTYNKKVNFIIVTDQKNNIEAENIKYVHMSLIEFFKLASKKLNLNINVKRPYKCCDFKPVYGIILEDYIKEYEFWGHCDFDMIFGDIKKFITDDIMRQYDKILPLGHLSLYRNTKENNDRYKCYGSKVGNYKEVFTSDKSYAFDEINGIYSIYKENKFPFYDKRIFADISMIYYRFRLALKDRNYKKQIFYWEDGKIYRAYEVKKKIKKEEYIYIHFKKRKDMRVNIKKINELESFYITSTGFYPKKKGIPSIEEINKYNKYKGYTYECIELIKFNLKNFIEKVKRKTIKIMEK